MDWHIWLPAALLTLYVVVFTGPGLWSNHEDWPFLTMPLAWAKRRILHAAHRG